MGQFTYGLCDAGPVEISRCSLGKSSMVTMEAEICAFHSNTQDFGVVYIEQQPCR